MANFSARSRTGEKKTKKSSQNNKRGEKLTASSVKSVIPREERKPRWEKKVDPSTSNTPSRILCSEAKAHLAVMQGCGGDPTVCKALGCTFCPQMAARQT